MKKNDTLIYLIVISFILLIFGCGSNALEDGIKALEKNDFNLAIKHLSEAKKEKPDDPVINEKLAYAYMLKGKDLFEKRKNLSAFTGNFSKGEEFIPATPSQEFQVNYSDLLFSLANAYQNTKPENDVQKEDFLNKTIAALETALGYNPENNAADEMLTQIKSDNFRQILDKGIRLYKQAIKEDNKDLYFTAEYYFNKACNFDSENEEAAGYLSKTRKKTLDVLDISQDFALAIADHQYSKGSYIFEIFIQNNAPNPIEIKHDNFILQDKNGTTYPLDKITMGKFKNQLPEKPLTDRKTISGIIAFKMTKKADVDYIGYQLNEKNTAKKYFP